MVKYILLILSAALCGLSFNQPDFSFLIWFSLTPFFYCLRSGKLRQVLKYGFVFSFLFYAISMFWLNHVTILGFFALLLYFSFLFLGYAAAARYFIIRPFRIFTLSFLWLVFEYLRENIWPDCGWANLAYSQFRNLGLIQAADIFGAKFISFLIVMVNIFWLDVFYYFRKTPGIRIKKIQILRNSIFIFLVILLCFGYSLYRLKTCRPSSSIEVTLIQPAIPEEAKYDFTSSPGVVRSLIYLGKKSKPKSLVIFPEAAWPFVVSEENIEDLQSLAKTTSNPCLIGAVRLKDKKFFNSALYFDVDGRLIGAYDKIRLVPYGEYVPLRRYLRFISVINKLGDMSAGRRPVRFSFDSKFFTVLICFEDVFSDLVRDFARESDFLINITNDAWFYGEPQSSQHLAIMTFRAVENRISIIRSANTGISGWVSFMGQPQAIKRQDKEVFFEAADYFTVVLNDQRSFYNKFGEWFVVLAEFMLIFFWLITRKKEEVHYEDRA
ncbi:MAG: apolipoprotein N-acyltransferase [Candidatus Omnitrophica bacterium]|nr:apolipoprotein N-acyltransferase [Candidatus Omnitrophota bacterium]